MTPNPASDQILTKVPTPKIGEWALRLALTERAIRPELVLTEFMRYRDLPINHTLKPDVDLWGDYILTQWEPGPAGYVFLWFAKDRSAAEIATPIEQPVEGSKHYDWPTVIHAWVKETDGNFRVTRTAPDGQTTFETPVERARLIITRSTFALCRTVTRRFLSPRPFPSKQLIQPVPGQLKWVLNGREDSITGLHPPMTLPAGEGIFNPIEIQGDLGDAVVIASNTRFFPGTPMEDWQVITIQYDSQRIATGQYLLTETKLYPPTPPERNTL